MNQKMARFLISFCLLIYLLVFHTRFFLVGTAIVLGSLLILARVCAWLNNRAAAEAANRRKKALAYFEKPEEILGKPLQTIIDRVGDFDEPGSNDCGIYDCWWNYDAMRVRCCFWRGYCDEIYIYRRMEKDRGMELVAACKNKDRYCREEALAHFENTDEILGQSLQTIIGTVGDFYFGGSLDHGIDACCWVGDNMSVTCFFKYEHCMDVRIYRGTERNPYLPWRPKYLCLEEV